MTALLIALIALAVAQTAILVVLVLRRQQATDLQTPFNDLSRQNERLEKGLRDEIARNREDQGRTARELREEVSVSLKAQQDSGLKQIEVLNHVTRTIETKLQDLQQSNNQKLEEMRLTVNEKLQDTLEKRIGDSFKMVSERLEQVHKGLGEMQTLASGVGDLKRVLTNVKTRGIWGEIQLRAILEQLLLSTQYESNVKIRPGRDEMVEFAVRLPGQDSHDKPVWLPIDSKFPKEDYERILEAQDRADVEGLKTSRDALARALKGFAKDVRDLYITPPLSTDFAILFLPTEGLFAEVCQYPGLLDMIQRDYRVTVAGPTTLAALLNSLQMGFQTLAIQERSSEVWEVLGAVKTEFGKFGDLLEGVEKKLEEAKNKVSSVRSKTTTIGRKLKRVDEIPTDRSQALLGMKDDADAVEPVTEDA